MWNDKYNVFYNFDAGQVCRAYQKKSTRCENKQNVKLRLFKPNEEEKKNNK